MDKQKLVELCKKGDKNAWEQLYNTYALKMKGVCTFYVHDEAVAEDILHDGFILIMSSIRQLKDPEKLENWMISIMKNLALKYLHDKHEDLLVSLPEIGDKDEPIDLSAVNTFEYKELLQLIDRLPKGYKTVFRLAVFEGLSHKEIGKKLGINPHSSSSQLARARELLQSLVIKYGMAPVIVGFLLLPVRTGLSTVRIRRQVKSVAEESNTSGGLSVCIHTEHIKYHTGKSEILTDSCRNVAVTDSVPLESQQNTEKEKHLQSDTSLPKQSRPIEYTVLSKEVKKRRNLSVRISLSGGSASDKTTVTTLPGSITSGEEEVKQVEHVHRYVPFVVSLSLHKPLTERWGFETGLRYMRLKADYTVTGEKNFRYTQVVQYIGIPLKANYKFWQHGGFACYVSPGVAVDIPIGGSNSWLWSLSSGIGLQYNVSQHIGIYMEPGVNFYVNPSREEPVFRGIHSMEFTVPVGIRFSW